ncbi:ferritin-like domain-containing protein [Flavobacterium sp. MK4S-17]|jgi:ferritin-like metal-binding protein YciE|uniref:YciE/YciF ferroxidase family protein n=1 Tax=Flavobacterium sp. MK4S-17 TaxID=2543737 RepID=UPI0013599300|nr:ferritin-like domain-containing protein [Flavobacterium sp. MK4S-17]
MKTATKTSNKSTSKTSSSSSKSSTTGGRKVKAKSTAAEGLKELYIDCLKDIYWAEKALLKALPKMAKNASSESLVSAIEEHITVTEEQVSRLEKVFELAGKKASGKKCDAMDGLIKEGEDILKSTEPGPVRDAGIIAASQKIEHYEIATYGTICAFAKTLGQDEAAELLHQTLEEEKQADMTLTENAYNDINFEAHEEDDSEE